jgi:exosortase
VAESTSIARAMSDAKPNVSSLRDRGLRLAAVAAILGLGTIAYRALLDYDPTAASRDLGGGDAAFFSSSGNSPFFVYSIAAWILFDRRERLFGALGSPALLAPGAALIAGAALVCSWAYYVQAPDLLAVSLMLACLGLSCWLGGGEGLRAALLPSLVLLALVPIPAVLVNAVVHQLQLVTSTLSVAILHAIGMEAAQVADQFAANGRVFQVIESCSGIRSIQTLLLSAILYQELFYRSRVQSVLLVVLAPFVGFVVNQIRVMTLVFNPYSDLASVHVAQGLLMLVVGILLIAALDALLSRWIPARPRRAARVRSPVALPRLALAAAATGVIAASSFVAQSPNIERELEWNPHDIALNLSGWSSQPLKLDRLYLGSTTFSKDANRRFQLGDEFVDVFAGVSERGLRSSSPLSPKTLVLGSGRKSTAEEPFTLEAGGPAVTAVIIGTHEGLRRVILWQEDVGTLGQESLRALLALDRGPNRRPGMPQIIRLSTPIAGSEELEAADSRLRSFGRQLLAEIERLEERVRRSGRQRAQQDAAASQPG